MWYENVLGNSLPSFCAQRSVLFLFQSVHNFHGEILFNFSLCNQIKHCPLNSDGSMDSFVRWNSLFAATFISFILSINDNDGKNNEKKRDEDFIKSKCLLKSHQILLHVITVPLTHSDAFSISKISFRQCKKSAFIPKPFDLIFMNRNQHKIDRNSPASAEQSCLPNKKNQLNIRYSKTAKKILNCDYCNLHFEQLWSEFRKSA